MDDLLPADPKARRLAFTVLGIAAVVGTVLVWWLSSYMESLTELARTDRAASLALFRSRVLPAFVVVVLLGVVCGALLLRQGLQIFRTRQFPLDSTRLVRPTPRREGNVARAIGAFLAFAGFLLAAVPVVILTVVLWLLGKVDG